MVSPLSAVGSALSGLQAASKRIQVSADNVANQYSTKTIKNGQILDQPYIPQIAQQVSHSGGGVQVITKDATPATIPVQDQYDPGQLVDYPNVDVATELVNQRIASYDYKANLKTLKVAHEMEQNLLDILS